ncbi:MAG: hypothetical protein LBG06_07445 [Deltaproteobacteria bacterium]|jgi:hypothetical protein|nr:hypothetical protein [Deltaproteobacteria bacterium]
MPETVSPRGAGAFRPAGPSRASLLLLAPLLLCASCIAALTPAAPDDSRRDDENFQDFLDVPFPSEMTLEKGRTVVFTRRDVLSGSITIVGPLSTDEILAYFDRHLERHGWTPRAEVTTLKTTVSTWSKGSKTLTVVAEEVTLSVGARSRATLYVAPPHTQEDLGRRTVYQSTEREHRERYSTTPIRGGSGGGGGGSSRGGYTEEDL